MLTAVTSETLAILAAVYLQEKNYACIAIVEPQKVLRDRLRERILDRYDSIPTWLAKPLKVRNKGRLISEHGTSILIVTNSTYLKGRTLNAVFCRKELIREVAEQYIPCGAQVIEYIT